MTVVLAGFESHFCCEVSVAESGWSRGGPQNGHGMFQVPDVATENTSFLKYQVWQKASATEEEKATAKD